MQVLEVGIRAWSARPFAFFQVGRRFNLDDVGAPVGELAHTGRPRSHACQIEHGKAGKGRRGPGKRHYENSGVSFWPQDWVSGPTFPDLRRLVYCIGGPARNEMSGWLGRKRLLFIMCGSNPLLCLEKTTSICHMTANGRKTRSRVCGLRARNSLKRISPRLLRFSNKRQPWPRGMS
jgi:hypothetical protein